MKNIAIILSILILVQLVRFCENGVIPNSLIHTSSDSLLPVVPNEPPLSVKTLVNLIETSSDSSLIATPVKAKIVKRQFYKPNIDNSYFRPDDKPRIVMYKQKNSYLASSSSNSTTEESITTTTTTTTTTTALTYIDRIKSFFVTVGDELKDIFRRLFQNKTSEELHE